MRMYTVTKPGGTKDYEFKAYTGLLEDIGLSVSNVPRTIEPATSRRWLYTWKWNKEAERFAGELRRRTRDDSWYVHSFDANDEERGPVAPIDIFAADESDGFAYALSPGSRERVVAAFPDTPLSASISISTDNRRNLLQQYGDMAWTEICKLLTGLTEDQILSLGGFRIFKPSGAVLHEGLPVVHLR